MSRDTMPDNAVVDRSSDVLRYALIAAATLLAGSAALLWWRFGANVFVEAVAAGLAWCF